MEFAGVPLSWDGGEESVRAGKKEAGRRRRKWKGEVVTQCVDGNWATERDFHLSPTPVKNRGCGMAV